MIKKIKNWYIKRRDLKRVLKAMDLLHQMGFGDLKDFAEYAIEYYKSIERNLPPQHFNCRCVLTPYVEMDAEEKVIKVLRSCNTKAQHWVTTNWALGLINKGTISSEFYDDVFWWNEI